MTSIRRFSTGASSSNVSPRVSSWSSGGGAGTRAVYTVRRTGFHGALVSTPDDVRLPHAALLGRARPRGRVPLRGQPRGVPPARPGPVLARGRARPRHAAGDARARGPPGRPRARPRLRDRPAHAGAGGTGGPRDGDRRVAGDAGSGP